MNKITIEFTLIPTFTDVLITIELYSLSLSHIRKFVLLLLFNLFTNTLKVHLEMESPSSVELTNLNNC